MGKKFRVLLLKTLRIYTCTPVDFEGDEGFFRRDSGLFSRGLRANGAESMAVMPGPRRDNDLEKELIRTDLGNLSSPDWWTQWKLDGLVLYSWASPRFTSVAEAVSDAGIPCMVVMDTSGLVSPKANPRDWPLESFRRRCREQRSVLAKARNLGAGVVELLGNRLSKGRLPHYRAADLVAVVTPLGVRWIRREIRETSVEPGAEDKVVYLPHPQLESFQYHGSEKRNLVVSAGRWGREDWGQKNPKLLLKALDQFLAEHPDWQAVIVGSEATRLLSRFPGCLDHCTSRVSFREHIDASELVSLFNDSKIAVWSSFWEGQQGTAAQALCCGCSVVAPFAAEMSCFRHYVSRESGRLAGGFHSEALAAELALEASSWGAGERDPARISGIWCDEFHANKVAARALELLRSRIG